MNTFADSEGILVIDGRKGFINNEGVFIPLPSDLPEKITVNGKILSINFEIFKNKGYLVYGDYNSILGNDYKTENGVKQYRYLGYAANSNPFSNIDFPDDINLNIDPWKKRWILKPWGSELSLCNKPLQNKSIRKNQIDLIQYKGKYWWGSTDYNNVSWLPERLAEYFSIQSPPGAYTPGSARGWHIHNGVRYYQTFILMPQIADVSVVNINAPKEAYENTKVTVTAVAKSYGINAEPNQCKTTAAWFVNDVMVIKNDEFIIDGEKISSISVTVPPGGATVKFVVNYKYDSPENECGFGYDNNEKSVTIASKKADNLFDFEVSKILYDTYAADKNVNSIVTFKNNSSKPAQNVPVKIHITNKGSVLFSEERNLNMQPNSSYDIYFPFKTPNDNTTLKIQADINSNNTFAEAKKDNNTKTIDSKVQKDFVPLGCTESRSWDESHFSHHKNVADGVDAGGNSKYKKVPVYADYGYMAELKGNASLYFVADAGVTTIKSGYGFRLEVETDVTVTKDGHSKNSSRMSEVKKASKATAYFLGNAYPMEVESASGNKVKFYMPKNPNSVSLARKIYIPANTPDGTYDITIKVEGADSPGGDLCKTIKKQISVKGSMYEDDYTAKGE